MNIFILVGFFGVDFPPLTSVPPPEALYKNHAPNCAKLPVFRFVHQKKGEQNCRKLVIDLSLI